MFNTHQGILRSVDGFTVGMKYQLNDGYYRGRNVTLTWIALRKQLTVKGERHRQVRCVLLDNKKYINAQLNHLSKIGQVVQPSNQTVKRDMSKVSNKIIILLAKKGNKEAKQEFVRRFHKLPKINK